MLSFGFQARPVVVTTGHCDGRLMAGRYDVRLMLSSTITKIGLRRYPIW